MFLTYFIRFVTKSPLSAGISIWRPLLRTQLVELFGVNKIVFPLVAIAVSCTIPHWVFDEFLLLGGPSFLWVCWGSIRLVTGRKMISSDNIPLAPEELITALCLAVCVMLAWVQNTGKEKVALLQGTFYSLLGKRNMTQCQERKFFLQIKRMNICLLLLIVKTHLVVLLYFVFLRSSNYFKKWISWNQTCPSLF